MIEIVEPGPFASIQDAGRSGFARLGVARSGAFDRGALRLANRLVGNRPEAAAIEVTLGGLDFRVHDAVTVALAGAVCPGFDWGTAVTLPAGATVAPRRAGPRPAQLPRCAGRLAVAAELGSRSTDTMSGLGPAALRRGDQLAIGADVADEISYAAAIPRATHTRLQVIAGPRDDWFTADALIRLTTATWTVRAESNRIGVRLDGPSPGAGPDGRAAQRADPARRAAGAAGRPADPVRPGRPGDRWLSGDRGGARRRPRRRGAAAAGRPDQVQPMNGCSTTHIRAATAAAAGIVSTHAKTMLPATPSARPRSGGWRRRP